MSGQLKVREQQMMQAFELEAIQNQLKSLLDQNPKKMESFKTKMLNLSLQYGLNKCSPESIINCGLQALMVNLPLTSGQGYVVNYGGQAVFDCGYKGWQVLAKRAGFSVLADVVYKCDDFRQSGFGHNKEMQFEPNYAERQSANDAWAKDNLVGVIVSILEEETKNETFAFVAADMIFKIVGVSPSQQSEKGKAFSPHENWAEQMFCAKAIKQVLSKHAIDIDQAADLHEAINVVNNTESIAQAQQKTDEYPESKFNQLWPQWKEIVESGKRPASAILTQLTSAYKLSKQQLDKLMSLRDLEPIEGEIQ